MVTNVLESPGKIICKTCFAKTITMICRKCYGRTSKTNLLSPVDPVIHVSSIREIASKKRGHLIIFKQCNANLEELVHHLNDFI